jgi:hypothetical protein
MNFIVLKSDFSSLAHLTFRYATCQYFLIFYMKYIFFVAKKPGVEDERGKIAP